MDENFDNPNLLERLSLIIAVVFLPLSLISAAIYPVKGFPLYSKGLMAGLVFLAIYASARKRRRDSARAGMDVAHAPPGRSNEEASRAAADQRKQDAATPESS